MIFSMPLRQWFGTTFNPGQIYRQWRKRRVLRQDLQRLVEDPYLLDDIGFCRETAEREIDRAVWEPVANLRVPPPQKRAA
jgi:uncharacterized protein YjiS (DUF1127 family)